MGVILALLFLAPVAVGKTGAELDRAAQKLTARAAAAADLRAPSAAIARIKAERQARARAEKKLSEALTELGIDADQTGKILESATVSDERYGSDGSVELTLSLATNDLELKRPRRHKRAVEKKAAESE